MAIRFLGRRTYKLHRRKARAQRLFLGLGLMSVLASCNSQESQSLKVKPLRDIGTISTAIENKDCPGDECYTFEVSSEDLREPASGRIIVDNPAGEYRGTITLFSGGGGTYLGWTWPPMMKVLTQWSEAGFRTVRVQWSQHWWQGASPDEGFAALASRPATVIDWIADNLTEPEAPLCIGGGSGGAAQVSYPLTHYGLENRLSLAVPWSGFWMGRVDIGCLDEDPRNASLHYGEKARRAVDLTYGFGSLEWFQSGEPKDTPPGPCSTRDSTYAGAFAEASIAGQGDYYYPNTLVWHILGGADQVGALAQGLTYYEAMVRAGSPHVRLDVLPGAPHGVQRVDVGLYKIRDVFIQECRVR